MTGRRKLQWLLVALTVTLFVWLKWTHYGVTHYNLFLLILLAWSLMLIVLFRSLAEGGSGAARDEKPGGGVP